eukprot:c25040_g1_i1 orf=503-3787(-)
MEVSQDDHLLQHHHQQQPHQPQQFLHQQHDKTKNLTQLGSRRGLLKVSLEASPLQQIQAPPCNIRSIAVASVGNSDDRALVYLGTDSGDLYLFTWHRLPLPTSPPASSSLTDIPKQEGDNTALSFTLNKNLGLSPVDCLCPLPRAGAIAALLNKQVVVLDLLTLSVLEWLPLSKGAFTLARAFGTLNNLQPLNGSTSSHGIVADTDAQGSPQTPKKSAVHGQLGRLFGSGRLSARRGGSSVSSGEPQSSQSILSVKKISMSASQDTLSGSQGFTHDKSSGTERFAVAVKQKLLLYTVSKENKVPRASSNGITVTIKSKEMLGPEEVVTMAWIENVIITGTYQEYMLFSVSDGRATLLFSLLQDLMSPPLLKVFPKELEVLLLMDDVGVAVNAAGHPTSSSLAFKEIPDAIGQSSAYVVVVKRGVIELYHRKTGAKVQSILLSDTVSGPNLVSDDEDGRFLVLSSAFKVYCLERVPLDEQLKELLRQKQFDEAVGLAEDCTAEADAESIRKSLAIVHAQAGFLLFFDLRFKDAVDHFLLSSAMHPAEIFPFFPTMTDRWRAMVPKVRYWGLHPPPQAIQNVIENKLRAIQRGLVLHSVSDLKGLPNGHDDLMPTSSRSKSSIIQEYTIQAMEQVIRYLKAARSKPMTSSMKEGVDTLLMQLFLKLGANEEMECFAASENSCLVEELEDLLQKSGKLRTLAFLYETKGMVEQALKVWQTLAEGNAHTPMPARRIQEIKSTDQVETSSLRLAAAGEASRLLEASSDGVLVLTHLKWILRVSQDFAIQILSSSKREKPIPPDDVLLGLDPSEVYVRQRYLQWLVQEKEEENSHYHTLLAVSLAKSAMESLEDAAVNTEASEERVPAKEFTNGSRGRLQEFLESSDKYDPSTVLALILDSQFWREQAILHRKLGDEIRVFQILALKLEDIEAAERYCTELGRPDAYMRLLDMYLKPGEGREPMYNAAVHLLQLHGTSLDPLQVLEALSANMPLQLAYSTIARMFRSRAHIHRQGQIVRHLTRAENFEARLSRLEQRNRHTLVTDQSLCGSCHSRFGTKLFALYPNGSVVCYKCFRNFGSTVDPVTGHDFEKDIRSSPNG